MPEALLGASAAVLKKIADKASDDIFNATTDAVAEKLNRLKVDFQIGFERYIERNYTRCSQVKTLLHRTEPVTLKDIYVASHLMIKKRKIKDKDFFTELSTLKNIVIIGTAGSGKSMFLKHTFLALCEEPMGSRLPLYVELRYFNTVKNKSLFEYIFDQWVSLIPEFKRSQMEYAMRSGKFIILLDGLDEVDYSIRDDCCQQILDLSYKYGDNILLITSRPDEKFMGWNEFYVASILPMEQPEVIELLNKMQFDENITSNFIRDVRERLFKTHREFLSNPLLCTMMLITYTEFAEIPSKMHIFYDRSFDVLFIRHDTTKPSYHRKFYTNLSADDFKRLFATVCMLSYVEFEHSFTEDRILFYIQTAIEFEKMNVGARDYLKDLIESISIILKDGIYYTFIHRSFQEYFTALFISSRQFTHMNKIIDRVIFNDSIIDLAMEMNKEVFENKYLRSRVAQIQRKINNISVTDEPHKVVLLFFNVIGYENGRVTEIESAGWLSGVLVIISKHYERNGWYGDLVQLIFEFPINGLGLKDYTTYRKLAIDQRFDGYLTTERAQTVLSRLVKSVSEVHQRLAESSKERESFVAGILKKRRRKET
jgi:NACHT domain